MHLPSAAPAVQDGAASGAAALPQLLQQSQPPEGSGVEVASSDKLDGSANVFTYAANDTGDNGDVGEQQNNESNSQALVAVASGLQRAGCD